MNLKKNLGIDGLDTRAISLFRVCLGLFFILELVLYRFKMIPEFYLPNSNLFGIETQKLMIKEGMSAFYFLHNDWQVYFFFGICLMVYLFFTLGYFSRFIAILAYFCYWNLEQRIGFAFGWNMIAGTLLFWSIFLPIGRHYSLDSFKMPKPSYELRNLAAFAIVLQVGIIYLSAFLLKTGSLWENGFAMQVILSDTMLAKPLASYITSQPILSNALNYGLLYAEALIILLLFFPLFNKWFRFAAGMAICLIHLGSFPFLYLGLYAAATLAIGFLFLPDKICNWFDSLWLTTFTKSTKPNEITSFERSRANSFNKLTTIVVGVFLVLILIENFKYYSIDSKASHFLQTIGISTLIQKVDLPQYGKKTVLRQRWNFFAPDPEPAIGWVETFIKAKDGKVYSLEDGEKLTSEREFKKLAFPLNYAFIQLRYLPLSENFYNLHYKKWLIEKTKTFLKKNNSFEIELVGIGQFDIEYKQNLQINRVSPQFRSMYAFEWN